MIVHRSLGLGAFLYIIKKMKSLLFSISVLFLAILMMVGCAVTKKLSAADILSKTTLGLETVSLDSASIYKDLFPMTDALAKGLLPNPHVVALVQDFARGILDKEIGKIHLTVTVNAKNQDDDTLWIRGLTANLVLDTLMDLPVSLRDSVKLVPGENKVFLVTEMPIDRRIFGLKDVESVRVVGHMDVSLNAHDEAVSLEFDVKHKISQEEKQALADKARTSVLNNIVSDWVGAISF